MTYIVKIRQELKYSDTLVLHFTDLSEAEQLIETVLVHADNIEEITIEVQIESGESGECGE